MRITGTKPLAALRLAALARIDDEAEACRLRFLTGGAGQALEYQATEAEGRAAFDKAAAGEALNPADYPFVLAEISAYAEVGQVVPLLEAAQQVVDQAEQWAAVGSAIKAMRRGAKLRVEAAASPAEIDTAASGIPWPSPT